MYMCQALLFLQGYLDFFSHFFLTFVGHFFWMTLYLMSCIGRFDYSILQKTMAILISCSLKIMFFPACANTATERMLNQSMLNV